MPHTFTYPFTKRLFLFCAFILFSASSAFAAGTAPAISSFGPAKGAVGASVTISGSNFNTTAANNIVFFGATKATVTAASANSLTVTVPAGATTGTIFVLNTASLLSCYSSKLFTVTYSGAANVSSSTYSTQVSIGAGGSPYQVAIGDIDGDGNPDIVVVNQGTNNIGVYLNKGTGGTINSASFAAMTTFSTGAVTGNLSNPFALALGDIDGDGKLDVITANIGNKTVSVLRNTSSGGSISFAPHADFAVDVDPNGVAIGDFDNDGKPDIVAINEGGDGSGNNVASVLRNTSSGTTINFATKVDVGIAAEPAYVVVGDFDNDGLIDFATANISGDNISVLHNTSTGNISFAPHADFSTGTGSGPGGLAVGDIDGDGKIDLVSVNEETYNASVLLNTSSGSGNIAFATHTDINVAQDDEINASLSAVYLADVDGDGKLDMVVIDSDNKIDVFHNSSTGSGNVSFGAKSSFAAGTSPYSIIFAAIGDLNGDGKPDIVTGDQQDGKISVLQNANPVHVISPTTTAISSSNNPSFSASPGNSVTFTATVLSGGSAVNEGTVTFTSNGTTILGGNSVVVSSGQASVTTSFSTPGPYTIQATFNGDANYSTSNGSLTQQVNLHPTTIGSLTAVSSTTTNAATVQYTATFAASVTGLSTSNFSLSTTGGVSGASVSAISGSGTTYTVTVNTGSGDGTIQLNLANASGLSPGVSNLPFTGTTYTMDKTAPTVTISAPSVSSITSGTGSVSYTVTYGDANFSGSNLSVSNITLNTTGTANGIPLVSGSGTSYTVTVSGITGAGSLGISIAAGTASDMAGNLAPASAASTTFSVVVPTTTISSLIAVGGTNTNAPTVQYTATFAAAVTGLSTSNFSLNTTGSVSGASIASVSGSGTTYTITVNTGTGDGTIQLNLANAAGISPGVSTALPFSGATFTIDKTAPTVSISAPSVSIANGATAVTYTVTYNDANFSSISLSALQVFQNLVTTGSVAFNGLTVQPPSGNTVQISFRMNGNGTMAFIIPAGTGFDLAGNSNAASSVSTAYTVDNTAPVVTIGAPSTSATSSGTVTYDVSFSDANFSTTSFNQYAVFVYQTGTANYTQATVVQNSATDFTVSVVGVTGDGTLAISVLGGTSADLAGNTDAGAGPSATFTVDNTPPAITISSPSATTTSTGPVTYDVTYADANFNASTLSLSDITLNTTGTATGTVSLSGSGTSYTVTISNTTGHGTLGISIGANTASDIVGNQALASGASDTFDVTSNDALLSVFQISNGTLSPSFSPATNTYSDNIANLTSGITLFMTTDNPNATITVNGNPVTSGVRTSTIPMSLGLNTLTIVVTAQDGITTNTYTVAVTRQQSINASFTSVVLSPSATLIGTTGPASLNFKANVPNSVNSIQVIPTAADATATITVNGTPVSSGTASQSITLPVGQTVITTVITAQDGTTTKNAIITVTRAPSADASLASLTAGSATLSPAFSPVNYTYAATVPYATTSITLTPTTNDPTATVTVNGIAVTSGNASGAISLNVGANTITTVVTAQNGAVTKTYTTNITRSVASTNALLASISTTPATTLIGATGPGYLNFTANVPYGTTSIQVTPTATDPTAIIAVNGIAVVSGTLSQNISLSVGANTVTTVLTAQDGISTKTVIITVTRAKSPDASLANLTAGGITLSPAFAASTFNYTGSVPYTTSSITLTPTTDDPTATVTVNGIAVTSGTASNSIALNVGANTITTVVTAPNGVNTQTYTAVITRLVPSTNALLASVSLTPSSSLVSTSGAGYLNYTTTVPFTETSVQVTPIAKDATATIEVNGTAVASGALSQVISLNVGANAIAVVITAQDGVTSKTVDITVNRVGAADAALANLTSGGTVLSPSFASTTLSYTGTVPYTTSSITLTPVTNDPTLR